MRVEERQVTEAVNMASRQKFKLPVIIFKQFGGTLMITIKFINLWKVFLSWQKTDTVETQRYLDISEVRTDRCDFCEADHNSVIKRLNSWKIRDF